MASKRALVIGSQLPPLRGANNDAAAMTAQLKKREFEVETLTGTEATRSGILAGYERLIKDVDPDGAAVFYYAGHGGYALHRDAGPGQRTQVQCIFPTDWTDAGEFRAILDVELSSLLARLTDKTHNATVILDCCHSSEMSRGPLVPRVYGAAWARGVAEFLARNPVDLSRVDAEANPHAVRLVATAPDRQAFETEVERDGTTVYRGLFSSMLERVLAECGDAPVTWLTIIGRVRELVREHARDQVPVAEGPADRLPFTLHAMKRPDAVVFSYHHGTPCLRASRILGAHVGAKYDIMPLRDAEHDPARAVAQATVVDLVGGNAYVTLEPDGHRPEAGSLGFPITLPYPPLQVAVTGATAERLIARIRAPSPGSPVRLEIVPDATQARFEIIAEGASLSTLDRDVPGEDVAAGIPLDDSDAGRDLLVRRLERWSKAEALRQHLPTEGLPPGAIELSWGRVEQGQKIRHDDGARMHVGEWLYVTVTNRSDRTLHVAIFDVGIAGKVTLLTAGSPAGRALEPGQSFTLGQRDGGPVRGLGPMSWPDDVPQARPRPESLVVIAASARTDFTRLETEVLPTRAARSTTNRLEAILDGFRRGQYRDLGGEPEELDGFCVHRIDFDLCAKPRGAGDQPPAA